VRLCVFDREKSGGTFVDSAQENTFWAEKNTLFAPHFLQIFLEILLFVHPQNRAENRFFPFLIVAVLKKTPSKRLFQIGLENHIGPQKKPGSARSARATFPGAPEFRAPREFPRQTCAPGSPDLQFRRFPSPHAPVPQTSDPRSPDPQFPATSGSPDPQLFPSWTRLSQILRRFPQKYQNSSIMSKKRCFHVFPYLVRGMYVPLGYPCFDRFLTFSDTFSRPGHPALQSDPFLTRSPDLQILTLPQRLMTFILRMHLFCQISRSPIPRFHVFHP